MRIIVDRQRCVGAAQCVLVAPAVFDQADDGLVILRRAEPEDGQIEAVHEAEEICPSRAITVLPR